MAPPRIDRMTEAPIVGQRYMVPTVQGEWNREVADWPVVGQLHEDVQFFNFPWKHYHVDGRFLTRQQQGRVVGYYSSRFHELLTRTCIGSPLQINDAINRDGFGKPVLMEKKCTIAAYPPLDADITGSKGWMAMHAAFVGRVCKHGKYGFVCPHQNVALGAVAAVDGVITCPLHGLRIDAASGRVLLNPG